MKSKNHRATVKENRHPKKENLILLGFKIRSTDDLEKEFARLKVPCHNQKTKEISVQ